ncbi:MAG: response regulator transcription factor [Clostridia bacterium]|nr:MAG: response regulator transcription factor [Clostridia bacterium]
MAAITILLVEDHAVVRAGLKMLLNAEPDLEVIGEAEEGTEAVRKALELRPQVVLLDISLKGVNGLEAARQINRAGPEIRLLVLTMHQNEEYFFQALQAGALGYVPKSAPDHEVLAAIRTVAAGKSYLHPSVAGLLVSDYLERVRQGEQGNNLQLLSDREREVLQLVAAGYSNKEIADRLCLSIHTVHNHRTRLMEKLGIHDRLELLKYALRHGLITME